MVTRRRVLCKHTLPQVVHVTGEGMGVPSSNAPVRAARVPFLKHPGVQPVDGEWWVRWVGHRQGEACPDIAYYPFTSQLLQLIRCESHQSPERNIQTLSAGLPFPAPRPTPQLFSPHLPWES